MTNQEPKPFIDYWNDIDQMMQDPYAIDTLDAGIEPEEIAGAQDEGWSEEDFVNWFAQKRDLTLREDWKMNSPQAQGIVRMIRSIADKQEPTP